MDQDKTDNCTPEVEKIVEIVSPGTDETILELGSRKLSEYTYSALENDIRTSSARIIFPGDTIEIYTSPDRTVASRIMSDRDLQVAMRESHGPKLRIYVAYGFSWFTMRARIIKIESRLSSMERSIAELHRCIRNNAVTNILASSVPADTQTPPTSLSPSSSQRT